MSQDERTTHFAGFAEAQFQDMQADLTALYIVLGSGKEQDIASAEAIIQQRLARRAYDLAIHVISTTMGASEASEAFAEGYIRSIPDMTELPSLEEEQSL